MYDTIKLEKGLYSITGKSFTQALEQLDPDENYADTKLAGLDAFERQLKRFDIKVSGAGSDRVEKFFASTESAVLFPRIRPQSCKAGNGGSVDTFRYYSGGLLYRRNGFPRSYGNKKRN